MSDKTIPSVALATADQHEEFCELAISLGSIAKACERTGLNESSMRWYAKQHQPLQDKIDQAREVLYQKMVDDIKDIMDTLGTLDSKEQNLRANATRVRCEIPLRMLGILNRRYQEKQAAATTSVKVAVGVISDESFRRRVQEARRQAIDNAPTIELQEIPEGEAECTKPNTTKSLEVSSKDSEISEQPTRESPEAAQDKQQQIE